MSKRKKIRVIMKNSMDKIKQSVKLYLKAYLYNPFFISTVLIILITFILLYLKKPTIIGKESLFWFFASTSQSMAAIFAVAGVFAVFRFQAQENKLRNLYDSHKKRFSTLNWHTYIGDKNADFWSDNEFLDKAKKVLEKTSRKTIKRKIQEIISEIEKQEEIKNRILTMIIIPLFTVSLTFFMSITFLPFSVQLAEKMIGLIVILIMLALILFSITSVFKFIISSISFK